MAGRRSKAIQGERKWLPYMIKREEERVEDDEVGLDRELVGPLEREEKQQERRKKREIAYVWLSPT